MVTQMTIMILSAILALFIACLIEFRMNGVSAAGFLQILLATILGLPFIVGYLFSKLFSKTAKRNMDIKTLFY